MKKQIILDGEQMPNLKAAVGYLAKQLSLSSSITKEPEALEEWLSSLTQETEVILLHQEIMLENLEEYGEAVLDLLLSVAQENEHLRLYDAKPLFQ